MKRRRILLAHLHPRLGAALARRIAAAGWQPVAFPDPVRTSPAVALADVAAAVVQVGGGRDAAVSLAVRCLESGIPYILVADRPDDAPVRLPRRLVECAATIVVFQGDPDGIPPAAKRVVQVLRFLVISENVIPAGSPRSARAPTPLGAPGVVVAMGASTGGTEALREILTRLPDTSPPVVVVQHMPVGFTAALAQRLDEVSALSVREAVGGEELLPGTALIAPAGRHLRLVRKGGGWRVTLDTGEPVNRHRPSVDVLLESVAAAAGSRAVGVLLTGMGEDGARGLLAMRRAGAETIAQDEATSVVYGMPRAAVKLGAARLVLPLERIAGAVLAAALDRTWAVSG